jgi:hypothetical protein
MNVLEVGRSWTLFREVGIRDDANSLLSAKSETQFCGLTGLVCICAGGWLKAQRAQVRKEHVSRS